MACHRRALELQPDFAEAHNNLGNALKDQGRLDEALACHRRALELKPDCRGPQQPGQCLEEAGKVGRGGRLLPPGTGIEAGLCRSPPQPGRCLEGPGTAGRGDRLFPPGVGTRSRATPRPIATCSTRRSSLPAAMPPRSARSTAAGTNGTPRRWRNSSSRIATTAPPIAACGWATSRPISAAMRQAFFTVPLFAAHDHGHFEIFCYSDVVRPDAITARLRRYADAWREHRRPEPRTGRRSGSAQDRIDILVDLTMHMARNRLLVFARKPAPVQACWLAYPGTTGLSAIDYRITDPSSRSARTPTIAATPSNRSACRTRSGATIRSRANRRSTPCRRRRRATSPSAA